eukprot:maker-scaffold_1-snap-gene-14.5-mRNA-1 protein AED:0.33 eAED:0.33 QI:87/1/1/1/0/0.33/3/139/119
MKKNEKLYLPGSLSLINDLDKKVLVVLRDGKHLIGKLASYDQYTNVVLKDTKEYLFNDKIYAKDELGLYVIKTDNIVIISTIRENNLKENYTEVDLEEFIEPVEELSLPNLWSFNKSEI